MEKSVINRISELKEKIVAGTATQSEKDQYVDIFYQNDGLSDFLYQSYKNPEYTDMILRTCIVMGRISIIADSVKEQQRKYQVI
ncbi:MAG: hypothetical protein LBI60_00650 [Bacteroidales bacterium]|jgi:hypothetical protein|nr:hypothetical protein [Bacteroidales bacterium]